MDPSRQTKNTHKSVNDIFQTGFAHIPNICENIIRSQLQILNVIGDISNFYTNNRLSIEGALLSAIFLQEPIEGTKYPTLNPHRNAALRLYLYIGSKFGYIDSGSLSCLAKSRLSTLYNQHYPNCIHKINSKDLIKVHTDLITSYVDDLNIGCSLKDVQDEQSIQTFEHDSNYDKLRLIKQAEQIVTAKSLKVLHLLDFCGFTIKKFNSCSLFVQNTLNKDHRLQVKNLKHSDIHPNQAELQSEILAQRKKTDNYADSNPPDNADTSDDMFVNLGMTISGTLT